jgi:hypothetical protein
MSVNSQTIKTSVTSPVLSLILEPDNPINTRLINRDTGDVAYTVSSEITKENRRVTHIHNAAQTVIAT